MRCGTSPHLRPLDFPPPPVSNEEQSGLLSTHQRNYASLSTTDKDVNEKRAKQSCGPDSFATIGKNLFDIALPTACAASLWFLLPAASVAFAGHYLGTTSMAAVGVAYYALSVFGLAPGYGLTFAVDTLCSQEYGRDPTSNRLGLFVQRSFFVSSLFIVILACIVQFCEPALHHMYEPEVASQAVQWLKLSPLFLCPVVYSGSIIKFCLNQYEPWLPTYALVPAALVLITVQPILLPLLGVRGSVVGLAIASWTEVFTLWWLISRNPQTRARFGSWRWKEAVCDAKGIVEFMGLGLPSIFFVSLESSAFDSTILIAGLLGPTPAAAWSALLSVILMFVYGSSGLSAAACAGVGRALGAGDAATAKRTAALACIVACCIGIFNSSIILGFQRPLIGLFTTQPSVVATVRSVMWLVPILHISDSIQYTLQGVFSGAGQNHVGTVALGSTLWLLGIGTALYTALATNIGLLGVVGGLTFGLLTECPILVGAAFWFFDWKMLAKKASRCKALGQV